MYTSLSIKNFRAFQSLEVEGLKRVNLFTGRNNSGKTSVLEAVYLLEGEHVTLRAKRLFATRGLAAVPFTNYSARTMPWATLFRDLGVDGEVKISGGHDTRHNLEVILTTSLTPEDKQFLTAARAPRLDLDARPVLIARRAHFGAKRDALWVVDGAIESDINGESSLRVSSYLVAGTKPDHVELARDLDELEVVRGTAPVVEALRLIDPKLAGLKTLTNTGPPLVHADMGGATLLPLAVVGDGVLRMIEIVFAILQNREKVVLIDEIENGFHYSALPKVWKLIHALAKEYNVQVFAVTHSQECAVAAHQAALESGDYDFKYYRIEQEDGVGRAFAFPKEIMQTAIDADLEVR